MPGQIARKLSCRSFDSFDSFREAFWKEVANDPGLSAQFSKTNFELMRQGKAPFALRDQHLVGEKGAQGQYILHHRTPIHVGGGALQ